IMSFVGAFALILSLSVFAGNVKEPDIAAMEMAYELILSPEEEQALANEVLNPVEEMLVSFPQEVYIYDQNYKLIHHATGFAEELLENTELQAIIADSSLLMEDNGEMYYLSGK
ncbi:hypothetical protein, partial [Xanthovirga aplysinae]|uniref:hypothetical protein n=1 Tax=Xanthovirga aplysinae TaxID=2529853 RepID=UPI0016574ECA